MLQELFTATRQLVGLTIILFVAFGAAAVTGLALLGGGVQPGIAAAAALATPLVCGFALGAAVNGARVSLAGVGVTLAVARALVHGASTTPGLFSSKSNER